MIMRRTALASGVTPGIADKKWGLDENVLLAEFDED